MNNKFDFMLELMRMMNTRMETFATKDDLKILSDKIDLHNFSTKQIYSKLFEHEERINSVEDLVKH
jgi:hypothetical protein